MRRFVAPLVVGLALLLLDEAVSSTGEPLRSDYTLGRVENGSISTVVKATGVVQAMLSVDVSSQQSGRVASVLVDFNDPVAAGQAMAMLDQDSFVARVREAQAAQKVAIASASLQNAAVARAISALAMAQGAKRFAESQSISAGSRHDEAEHDFQRKLELLRSGSVADRDLLHSQTQRDISAQEQRAALEDIAIKEEAIAAAHAELLMAQASLENANALVEQRQAELDQASLDLNRTVLRAPIDGVVIKRDVNPGQTVAVSLQARTLFTIARDLRAMEVHGRIDEADVGSLRVGQPATFTVDAFPNRTFHGQVTQIRKAPEVVQSVVTYIAVVSAPNEDLLLLPGMTADLRIVTSDTGPTIEVPIAALWFRPNGEDAAHSRPPDAPSPPSDDAWRTLWVPGPDGAPIPVSVKVGLGDEKNIQLTEGPLSVGQLVIVGKGPKSRSDTLGTHSGS